MGMLRVILAISVIAGHAETTIFGLNWLDAFPSVQMFFAISGFYMALVLNGKYSSIPLRYFYKSRALRIYPTYFVSVVFMFIVGRGAIRSTFHSLTPFTKVYMYVENTIILGQDLAYVFCMRERTGDCAVSFAPILVPPAWSLSVELGFYLVAPFVVRDVRRILLFIGIGIAYHLLTLGIRIPDHPFSRFSMSPFALKYYFYASSSIFFGLGALSYHKRDALRGRGYLILVAAVIAFAYIDTPLPPWSLLIFSLALPEIFRMTKSSGVDRAIGEYSYPLYLLHWPMLTLVQGHSAFFSLPLRYLSVGTIVTVLSAVAAFAVYLAIDRPLDRLRHPPAAVPHGPIRETAWIKAALVSYFALPFAMLAAIARYA